MVHSVFEDCINFLVNFLEFPPNQLENSMANECNQQNGVLLACGLEKKQTNVESPIEDVIITHIGEI